MHQKYGNIEILISTATRKKKNAHIFRPAFVTIVTTTYATFAT